MTTIGTDLTVNGNTILNQNLNVGGTSYLQSTQTTNAHATGDLTVDGTTYLQAVETTSLTTPSFTTTGDLTVGGTATLNLVEATNVMTPLLTLSGSPFSFLSNTYSPTVIGGPGFNVIYTTQTGKYVRIGDFVKVYFDIQFNGNVVGLVTPLRITLPFNNALAGQTGTLSTLCTLPNPPIFPITLNLRQAGFNYGALFSATQPNTSPIMPQTGNNQRLVGTISYFATP